MIPPSIIENHKAAIRSTASKNQVAENEIVRLYQAATEILDTGNTKALNIMPSKLTHPVNPPQEPGHRIELVTVTNHVGLFVQLAVEYRKAAGPILLTIGQKFSMEGTDPVTHSTSTRMF